MNKMFDINQKIGEIATKFPRSIEVFKKYNIDFCCGGDRPLKEATDEKNLNGDEVIAKINEDYERYVIEGTKERDWENESYTDTIDYVVNKHHAYLNENLPRLSELTTKILRVHGANHSELKKVHKLLHELKMELEQHLIKEEEVVFPLVKQYEKGNDLNALKQAAHNIVELEEEHEGAGNILKELREITDNYMIPQDACNTYRLTYQLLENVEDDTFRHIHLENNILFPSIFKKIEESI